jgi:hypothetical protein
MQEPPWCIEQHTYVQAQLDDYLDLLHTDVAC